MKKAEIFFLQDLGGMETPLKSKRKIYFKITDTLSVKIKLRFALRLVTGALFAFLYGIGGLSYNVLDSCID